MNDTTLLNQIRIAKPCPARWEDMTGDERARFCAHCQKHVYNLSAMTSVQAAALVREKEGKLCARFYRRRDGTMLTADCPVGLQRIRERFDHCVTAIAATIAIFLSGFGATGCNKRSSNNHIAGGISIPASQTNRNCTPIVGDVVSVPLGEMSAPVMGKPASPPAR